MGLTWKAQLKNVMNKAYRAFWTCKGTFAWNPGCTGADVYRWGSRKGHSFSLGLHTMIFQAEICAIKACLM
jgi:hypothetical protein